MQKGQVVGLDLVRFLAALAVAAHHLGGSTWLLPVSTPIRSMVGVDISMPQFAWMYHGWVGVEIFFVISGVVIAYSAQQASAYKFATGRIVRMAPALWICATATAIVVWFSGQENIWQRYFTSIFFLPAGTYIDPSHWTLAIEIVFYGIVFLLIALGWRKGLLPVISCIGMTSAIAWFAYAAGIINPPASRTLALLLLQHGIYFAIGVLLQTIASKKFNWGQCLLLVIFSAGAFLEITHQHNLLNSRLIDLRYASNAMVPIAIWGLSLILIIISIVYNEKFSSFASVNKFLRKLGLATYPLYLINAIIGAFVFGIFVKNGVSVGWSLFLTIASCIVGAVVIADYIEPYAKKYLKKVFDVFGDSVNLR